MNLRVRPVTRTGGALVNQDYRRRLTTAYRRAEGIMIPFSSKPCLTPCGFRDREIVNQRREGGYIEYS